MEDKTGCMDPAYTRNAFTKAVPDKELPDDALAQEALFGMVPEFRAMAGFEQNNIHHVYDVWQHTMKALSAAGDDIIVRLAVLFHDIGKPHCYTQDEHGIGHFYGHGAVSSGMTRRILEDLGFDCVTREKVGELVKYHDLNLRGRHKSVRNWLNRLGKEQFYRLLAIFRCDAAGQNPDYLEEKTAAIDRIAAILEEIASKEGCLGMKDLAVTGHDLILLGVPQGRQVGETLQRLCEVVSSGAVPNERKSLLDKSGEWLGVHNAQKLM